MVCHGWTTTGRADWSADNDAQKDMLFFKWDYRVRGGLQATLQSCSCLPMPSQLFGHTAIIQPKFVFDVSITIMFLSLLMIYN